MINLSKAFRRELYENRRNYLTYADITLANGTVLNLTNEELWSGGFSKEDAVSGDDSFTALGATVMGSASIVVNNMDESYSDYDFTNAKTILYIALMVSDGGSPYPEKVKMGTYNVDDTGYNGGTIRIDMIDNMALFERPYSESTLAYPATLDEIVRDACTTCGVTLNTYDFPHKTYTVQTRPEDEALTFREVIGWAAAIAGCFARCNRDGQLELKWFNQTALASWDSGNDGGSFDSANPYATGDAVNGGTFNPWNTGDAADGGDFITETGLHNLSHLYSQDICVDETVITGVRVTVNDESDGATSSTVDYMSGTKGYVIGVSGNEFITTDTAQTVADWLGAQLIGVRFRKLNVTHASDPAIEAGDVGVVWDRKNRGYPILVTRTAFAVGAVQTTVCGAETPSRNSAARYGSQTKAYVEMRKNLKAERATRQQVEAQLARDIATASGLYPTDVVQPDQSVKHYLHNKPQLSQSDIQILVSDVGITVTANGTAAQPDWYGLRVNGDLIARILTATGVNADWINTGSLSIGGQDNTDGSIKIYNASGTLIGTWDKNGIYIIDGTIGSWVVNDSGIRKTSGNMTVGMLPGTNAAGTFLFVADDSGSTTVYPFVVYSDGRVKMSKANVTGGQIALGGTEDVNGNIILKDRYGRTRIKLGSAASSSWDADAKAEFFKYLNSNSVNPDSKLEIDGGKIIGYRFISSMYKSLISFNNPPFASDVQKANIWAESDAEAIRIAIRNGSSEFQGIACLDLSKTQKRYPTSGSLSREYYGNVQGGLYVTPHLGSPIVLAAEAFFGDVEADSITISGTKSRRASTPDYADRLLYCYETPSPLFGDVGEGVIGKDGKCYVSIDPVFSETVTLSQYQVFLQKYGPGECYVSERRGAYFIVEGTPGLSFGWELKARQAGYEQRRLERNIESVDLKNKYSYSEEAAVHVVEITNTDYAGEAIAHIENIMKERAIA